MRKRRGGTLAHAAALAARHSEMELAAEERPRRQHHRLCPDLGPVSQPHSVDAPAVEDELDRLALDERHALLTGKQAHDCGLVEATVGLDPRPANGGALARVEHPVVDRGAIAGAPDQSVERVHLADQMAFAEAAHGRVARHHADLAAREAKKRGRRAHARRRGRRLGSSMPATHDDDAKAMVHAGHLVSCFTWNNA
jgi:hypothetical protein